MVISIMLNISERELALSDEIVENFVTLIVSSWSDGSISYREGCLDTSHSHDQ